MPDKQDAFLKKVCLIMESPTERSKYKDLDTFEEKISFLRGHFILNEMEIRLLERKYLLDSYTRDALLEKVDAIITRSDI